MVHPLVSPQQRVKGTMKHIFGGEKVSSNDITKERKRKKEKAHRRR
jgi:hypothetical protein